MVHKMHAKWCMESQFIFMPPIAGGPPLSSQRHINLRRAFILPDQRPVLSSRCRLGEYTGGGDANFKGKGKKKDPCKVNHPELPSPPLADFHDAVAIGAARYPVEGGGGVRRQPTSSMRGRTACGPTRLFLDPLKAVGLCGCHKHPEHTLARNLHARAWRIRRTRRSHRSRLTRVSIHLKFVWIPSARSKITT